MRISSIFVRAMILTLLLGTALLTSCEKEANEPETTITGEEAAQLLEASLNADTEGLAEEMLLAAELAERSVNKGVTTLACGETRDSSIIRTIDNNWVNANYSSNFSWTLICNAVNVPTDLNFTRQTEGDYETAHWISDDEASSNWTISQLLTNDHWLVNGSYERLGYQESKVRDMRTFNSTITYQVTDLQISKATRRITVGTASFSIAGENSAGQSFLIAGTLTFNGDGTATLTINGETFVIEL